MSARILWQRMPIQVPMPKWSKVCIHCLLTFILSRCNFLFCCRCHASSGKCDCKPGWTGIFCDTPCPSGRYGQDCQEKCDCKNGATCSHIKGEIPYLFGLPKGFPMNPCCFLLKLPWNMGQFEIFSSLVTTLRFPVFNPCEEVKEIWDSFALMIFPEIMQYSIVFENRSYKKVTESAHSIIYKM